MARNLSNLRAPKKANTGRKRIGRGMGSGMGKTSTRGHKGQGSRSGSSLMRGFEGGQMPLHRRLPKRGFTNIFRRQYAIVNVGALEALPGDTFSPESLMEAGVIRKLKHGLKILGAGELTRTIAVKANLFTKSALEKIQAAGGTAEVIGK
ncbi:MAG TPA: 50S ribosomal protein L15 [Bryobacteraceae bacterium]|nr:50S ribosomal protein L15 [Bryobacteraceae bacterium]